MNLDGSCVLLFHADGNLQVPSLDTVARHSVSSLTERGEAPVTIRCVDSFGSKEGEDLLPTEGTTSVLWCLLRHLCVAEQLQSELQRRIV